MTKSTEDLMRELQGKTAMQQFFDGNRTEMADTPLCARLCALLERYGLEKSAVVTRSQLDRSYAYHLFSGSRENPSRNVILALSLAMMLPLEEVQSLLRVTGYAMLYPRIRRDAILIRAVNDRLSVLECNEMLEQYGEPLL